jgi:hypothetical protein
MGRGLLGLAAETPPFWLRSNEWRRSSILWTLWWFVSGAEVDGKRRSNATFVRFGTQFYVWSDRMPTTWVTWPRLLRSAIRLGAVWVGWHAWQLYQAHPGPVGAIVVGALCAAMFAVGWVAGDSLLLWPHRRRWVWPLHRALVAEFGYHPRTPLRRYLWVPRDYQRRGVWVALPPNWTSVDEDADRGEGEDRAKAIVARVRTKLALGPTETTWRLTGNGHELVVRRRRDRIRPSVLFAEQWVRDLVEESPESAPLLGVGEHDTPVRVDLDAQSPHLLLSMLTGEGKSVLLRSLGAQVLHQGGEVTILDFKRRSQKWAKGLARVNYCREVEKMHLALIDLAMTGDERNRDADDWEDSSGEPVFPRHLLIVEEANATIYKLQLWWDLNRRRLRDELEPAQIDRYCGHFGDTGRNKSPAVLALADILFMGRQSFIHVAAVGQYTTAHAMGGPAIREQFGARGIKGSGKAFAMLAPELDSVPASRGHRGRIHLVLRGKAVELQVMMMSGAEARSWATTGPRPYGDATTRQRDRSVVHQGNPTVSATDDGPVLVSLKDAVDSRLVSVSLASLRSERWRDAEFPEPAGRRGRANLYHPDELADYCRNRQAAEPQAIAAPADDEQEVDGEDQP